MPREIAAQRLDGRLVWGLGEINGQKVFGALLPAPRPKGEGFPF